MGFFQTEKYFQNVEDDLRQDFVFHDEILNPCKEMINSLDENPIFLHVRRGDPTLSDRGFKWAYTECSSQHPPQPLEYYEKALEEFDSDVPVWSGAIIANSSLSWWGAWLQNGKGKVVAPSMWFGPTYSDKDTKDLYCESWKVI